MPGAPEPVYDPVYVRARRILLDALDALQEHRGAVLLVGAQAIYLHTGDADFAAPPYTTDADLALNPAVLADDPKLEVLMTEGGFTPAPGPDRIGTWIGADNVPIDLMVPEAVSGPGKRAARLGAHGNRVARKARGLEAALVDNVTMTIDAFEHDDARRFEIRVAGPSALLVAKLHKLAERQAAPTRLDNKDALDVYRLLVAISTEVLVQGIGTLLQHELSQRVTQEALAHLESLFGDAEALGSQMTANALAPQEDPATTAASCAALAGDLLEALQS
ncbi:MAG TPA: GSU2403 family nucleotidyltransferase fold protein [Chloroflexota bacterium]|jgi:hypothetical protein